MGITRSIPLLIGYSYLDSDAPGLLRDCHPFLNVEASSFAKCSESGILAVEGEGSYRRIESVQLERQLILLGAGLLLPELFAPMTMESG